MILILILILIVIGVIIAAAIASDESRKLDTMPGSDVTYCLDYQKKYGTEFECPYYQNACKVSGPGLGCIFNPEFIRYFDIAQFLRGGYTTQDTFNEAYFIKRDQRSIDTFKCKKDISECELERGVYIKIINDGVFRVSKDPKTEEYYIFSPISFYTETLPRFITEKEKITSADQILEIINATPFHDCNDADSKKQGELKNVCIFHKVATMQSVSSVLEKLVYKNVNESVLVQLQQRIKNENEMDLLNYIIYTSLTSYLGGSKTRLFWGSAL